MHNKIIILNGTSSSGKTTLARTLQSMSSEVFLYCSLDAFWDMTPYGIPAGSVNFPNMKLAMAKAVKGLVETGHNVIVDIVFCGQKTYGEFTRELEALDVTFVKLDCPMEELARREVERQDRKIGLAESQYESVHNGVSYDLIVNTLEMSPEQCAQMILESFKEKGTL